MSLSKPDEYETSFEYDRPDSFNNFMFSALAYICNNRAEDFRVLKRKCGITECGDDEYDETKSYWQTFDLYLYSMCNIGSLKNDKILREFIFNKNLTDIATVHLIIIYHKALFKIVLTYGMDAYVKFINPLDRNSENLFSEDVVNYLIAYTNVQIGLQCAHHLEHFKIYADIYKIGGDDIIQQRFQWYHEQLQNERQDLKLFRDQIPFYESIGPFEHLNSTVLETILPLIEFEVLDRTSIETTANLVYETLKHVPMEYLSYPNVRNE